MSSLWARIEPLLARVQKPARYIGCEDGAIAPGQLDACHRDGAVSWSLASPDTYEIGLPNQGLQILYDNLNTRAVAQRAPAPRTRVLCTHQWTEHFDARREVIPAAVEAGAPA